MALTDLLAALERDAEQRIASDHAAATAQAAEISRQAAERVARRREEAVGREAARLRAEAGRQLALATRDAEHAVLASRETLLARVLELARGRIRDRDSTAKADETLLALAAAALGYAGGAAVRLRSAPDLAKAAAAHFRKRAHLEIVPDPALESGSVVESTDGRLAIDATLEGRLAAREAEARIEILRLLERAP